MTEAINTADAQAQAAGDAAKSTLPEERSFIVKRPGAINKAGGFVGCALKGFGNAHECNEFFRRNANLLVVEIWPMPDHVLVLYTNTLEGEELEEFNDFSREWAMKARERKMARAEAEQKAKTATTAAEAEVKRLVEKGKKCEDHHGGLLDRIDKLEKEVKRLRKESKR